MVRHGTAKKRRSGVKVTRPQQKHRVIRIANSVVNQDIKASYDKNKSPKDNLSALGLVSDANNIEGESKNNSKTAAFLGFARIVDTNNYSESNPKRKMMSEVDYEYAKDNVAKHGTNYKAMERDIKTNHRQYTEQKMETLCKKYESMKSHSMETD